MGNGINLSALEARYENHRETLDAVSIAFVEEQNELVSRLVSALDPLERERVREIAHALRGSALNVCAEELVRRAGELERQASTIDIDSARSTVLELRRESERAIDELTRFVDWSR